MYNEATTQLITALPMHSRVKFAEGVGLKAGVIIYQCYTHSTHS